MFHSILFPRVQNPHQKNAKTDIYDVGDHYLLQVEAVGFSKEDIQLSATENTIKVEASKEFPNPEGFKPLNQNHSTERTINRRFRFREQIDTDTINAKINHGLLSIKLPKKVAQKISIKVN